MRNFRIGSSLGIAAIAVLVLVLAAISGPAQATDGTWNTDAGAGNLNWSTAANWLGGLDANIADGNSATANITFNITAGRNVVIDSSRRLGILNIGDITTTSHSFTLSRSASNTLTLNNLGSAAQINQIISSNGDTISAVVLLEDSLNINNQSTAGKTLTISGAISANNAGTKIITNQGTGAGTARFTGTISNGSGTVALVQNSATSTMQLSGGNTFTSGVTLSAGKLILGYNKSGTTTVLGTGTLTINGGTLDTEVAGQYLSASNPITINNDFAFAGSFGSGSLDLGDGAVTLGTTDINANTVRQITVSTSSLDRYLMLRGNISDGTTANSLTKSGPGLLVLNGTNGYTGATTISNGALQFGKAASIGGTGRSVVVGANTMVAGYAIDNAFLGRIDNVTSVPTGVIALGADSSNDLEFNSDPNGANLTSAYLGAIRGAEYSGTLTPNGGFYRLGGSGIGGGGWLTMSKVSGLAAGNAMDVKGNVILAATNPLDGVTTVNSGATLMLGAGQAGKNGSVAGNITTNSTTNGGLVFNNADAQTYSGVISGGGSLTKQGVGTLTLDQAHTFTQAVNVNNGTLKISGAAGSINLSATAMVFNGGTLELVNTAADVAVDRVRDATAITSYGGAIKVTNTADSGVAYAETVGALTMQTQYGGKLDIALTNDQSAGSGNMQTLSIASLNHSGAQSVVTFSAPGAGLNASTNIINVPGATATAGGQIIGPWATTGASANNQSDYAVYDASKNVVPAAIGGSDQSTWTVAANAYTMDAGATLDATRTVTALRNTGAAHTLDLNGFNLETYGILNGGTGTLTINGATAVRQQGTAANTLFLTTNSGGGDITINAPITANTGALKLVVSGGGTTTLNGVTSLSGSSTSLFVQDGATLKVTNNCSGAYEPYIGSGNTAPAKLLVTGGTFAGAYNWGFYLGFGSNGGDLANGHQMEVTGGTLNLTYSFVGKSTSINNQGVATLTIDGGTVTGNNVYFGEGPGALATINLKSGSWGTSGSRLAYNRLAKDGGSAVINQTGGTAYFTDTLCLGIGTENNLPSVADGSATWNISGGTLDAANLSLCFNNDIVDGWSTNNRLARTDDATVNLSGTGTVIVTSINVGRAPDTTSPKGATGTVNITGGEFRSSGTMSIAYNPDTKGVVNLKGGTLAVSSTIRFGKGSGLPARASAQFNFTGGTLRPYTTGTLTLDGSLGTVTQDATDNDSLLELTPSTGGNANVNCNYTAAVSSGDYLATVNVGADKTLTMASGKTLTIGNQATLVGAGTVTSGGAASASLSILSGGTLSPGASGAVGTLTVGSVSKPVNLSMANGSVYDWQLADVAASDKVAVTGDLTLSDTWTLKLETTGVDPDSTAHYPLFSYTGGCSLGAVNVDFSATDWSPTGYSVVDDTLLKIVYITGLSAVLLGDTNDDGVVDAVDYIAVKTNFGLSGTGITRLQGDLIDNDVVDWDDLQELMNAMATRSVGGAPAAAPEPATLGLLAIGALAVIRRRRKA